MTQLTTFRATRTALAMASVALLGGCAGGLFGGGDKDVTPTIGDRMPVLSTIESGAVIDPALASVSVVLPPAQANTEWAQAGGSANKSTGNLALGANPAQIWSASIAGSSNRRRLAGSPVIGGGKLFVVDTDGTVNAFDANSGSRLWSKQIVVEGNLRNSAFGGGVSFGGGPSGNRVYATNGVGEVIAMDANTGAEIWKVKPAGPLRGSPTIAFNSIYVMTQDNKIVALNAADGAQQWLESGSTTQAGVFGVAAPAAGQGTVIAGYSSGELAAYRYENGRLLWSDALARTSISTEVGSLTDIDADPIIEGPGRVYALGQGGRMATYELVTGQRVWELNLAGISTPAIAGEWIFTLTDDARLLAIARSTGKVRWIAQLGQYRNEEKKKNPIYWTGPVLAGGNLFVASSEGQVTRVDAASGNITPFVELDAAVSLPPVVANNTLYILDDSGRITAFR